MEEKSIPYFIHEGIMTHAERTIKKLIFCVILAIVLLFATNAVWLYAWMQYDYSSEEIQVDADEDPATTPTPVIEMQNANLVISRIA